MILWHIGGTLALTRYLFRDSKMDVRLLLVGALLPDLIDKPIGRVLFTDRFESGRIFGHTLLFSALVLVAVLLFTKRGTARRKMWVPLAIGSLLHLFLDFMWVQPETLLWPALGWDFYEAPTGHLGDTLVDNFTNPWVLLMEVVGLAYLIWLWRRADLGDRTVRREVMRTGRIPVPIGSAAP